MNNREEFRGDRSLIMQTIDSIERKQGAAEAKSQGQHRGIYPHS